MIDLNKLVLVVLAGGKGRRMGSNTKPLLKLGDKLLIQHVINKAEEQIFETAKVAKTKPTLLLNVNDNLQQYQALGLPVQTDIIPDYAGPLAGVLSAMAWALQHQPQASHILTIAADTPFFPNNYIEKMCNAIPDKIAKGQTEPITLAVASYQGRSQPVFGLWPVSLKSPLQTAITIEGMHKVDAFTSRYGVIQVPFADNPLPPHDPFFNINRPEELEQAHTILAGNSCKNKK